MFVTPEAEIVFNEVNTIPGFTPHRRYPRMMKAAGLPLNPLVTPMITQAVGTFQTMPCQPTPPTLVPYIC